MPDPEVKLDEKIEARLQEMSKAAGLSDAAIKAVKAALTSLKTVKKEMPDEDFGKVNKVLAKLCGYGYEKPAVAKSATPAKPTNEEILAKVSAELRPQVEAMIKSQDENQTQIALLKKSIDDSNAVARKKEFLVKSAGYPHLPVDSADLGAILMAVADADTKAAVKLDELLTKSEELLKSSDATSELGSAGVNPEVALKSNDAMAKIDAKAKELVQKSADGMSHAKAVAQVLVDFPELYEAYTTNGGV